MCRAFSEDEQRAELQQWQMLLRRAAWLTLPVFLTAMVLPLVPWLRPLLKAQVAGFPLEELVKWAFATPVQFWVGARFHRGAWRALRAGRLACTSSTVQHVLKHARDSAPCKVQGCWRVQLYRLHDYPL